MDKGWVMDYVSGLSAGGFFATGFVTRLFLLLFRRMGENRRRLYIAHSVAYSVIVLFWIGFWYVDGEIKRFVYSAVTYVVSVSLWLIADLIGFKWRMLKRQIPTEP